MVLKVKEKGENVYLYKPRCFLAVPLFFRFFVLLPMCSELQGWKRMVAVMNEVTKGERGKAARPITDGAREGDAD